MSTLGEIESALPNLTDDELARLDRTLHRIYRERHSQVHYDDAHGLCSDVDLIAAAEEAFLAYDKEEEEHAKRPAR
jgi:hypothetical protein